MKARGGRLACSLRTEDGSSGSYSVYPGEAPRSIEKVEPVSWDKPPHKDVVQGAFSVIGEMGMTGTILLLNADQWRALNAAELEQHFYAAILWGGNAMKVVGDAQMIAKRGA